MTTTPAAIITSLTQNVLGAQEAVVPLLFSWLDYTIFVVMLGMSAAIGIYVGFFGKKQDNTTEYILAGKSMNIWPIAMSLIASEITDLTILSADIYTYGATVWLTSFTMAFAGQVTSIVFLPVFFKLQLTCVNEYLTLRFDPKVRLLTSFFFVFSMLTFLPIIIFIPALAFNQATGINLHLITPIVCSVCIFYTTFGGLKAVVWTDTLQFIIIIAAMGVVLVLGFVATGNIGYIFQKSYEGGRLFIWDMDLDPTKRTSFWSVLIGTATGWACYMGCSQTCIQKFMAVPTLEKARQSIWIFVVGIFVFNSFCTLTGLMIYAKYSDCDPVITKQVKQADQIVPYFIMDVGGNIPGLPGLFIAGVFCGALSSLSAGMNTLSGVIYEDFMRPYMPANTTEKRASDVMKCIVVIVGVIATALVFIVEHLGSIFTLAVSLGGLTSGPMIGMFILGMLVPLANTKGTLTGAIGGLFFISWIVFGAQYYTAQGAVNTPPLSGSIDGCNFPLFENLTSNATLTVTPLVAPWIYRISFFYYPLIGGLTTVLIGVVVSLLTGGRNQKVNRDLLSPVIYCLLTKEEEQYNYNTVKHAIELTQKNSEDADEIT